jgi:ABC-2 type transport system permease protein
LSIAGFALWLSTLADAPLGAVGLGILDNITALCTLRTFLRTHGMYAWADILQTTPDWTGMAEGVSVSASYAVIFAALAYRHFHRKDIVS